MSLKEILINTILFPVTGAVDIRFKRDIDAKAIYQRDYPVQKEKQKVIEGKVAVRTGSTMAFSFTDLEEKSVRAIIVRDYAGRPGHTEGVSVKEAKLNENGKIREEKLAHLSPKNPQAKIQGIGVFKWRK